MSDEFAFAAPRSTAYDPDKFYVLSQDSKGHSENVRLKLPPDVWRRICEMAFDPSNPFRSPQDVIRNSVIHGLNTSITPDSDPAFVRGVQEVTAQAWVDTQLIYAEGRRKLIQSAEKLAKVAAECDPDEKTRIFTELRLQTIECSDETRSAIGNLIRRYEK